MRDNARAKKRVGIYDSGVGRKFDGFGVHGPCRWRKRPRMVGHTWGSVMTTYPTGARKGGKPRVLKLAEGIEASKAPKPPKTLGEVGRTWWVALWRGGERWLDVHSDFMLVEIVCQAQDKLAAIEKILESEGRYYLSKQGLRLPSPAVADSRNVSAQIVAWLSLLGFTPTDRARLGVQPSGVSELQKWREKQEANNSKQR